MPPKKRNKQKESIQIDDQYKVDIVTWQQKGTPGQAPDKSRTDVSKAVFTLLTPEFRATCKDMFDTYFEETVQESPKLLLTTETAEIALFLLYKNETPAGFAFVANPVRSDRERTQLYDTTTKKFIALEQGIDVMIICGKERGEGAKLFPVILQKFPDAEYVYLDVAGGRNQKQWLALRGTGSEPQPYQANLPPPAEDKLASHYAKRYGFHEVVGVYFLKDYARPSLKQAKLIELGDPVDHLDDLVLPYSMIVSREELQKRLQAPPPPPPPPPPPVPPPVKDDPKKAAKRYLDDVVARLAALYSKGPEGISAVIVLLNMEVAPISEAIETVGGDTRIRDQWEAHYKNVLLYVADKTAKGEFDRYKGEWNQFNTTVVRTIRPIPMNEVVDVFEYIPTQLRGISSMRGQKTRLASLQQVLDVLTVTAKSRQLFEEVAPKALDPVRKLVQVTVVEIMDPTGRKERDLANEFRLIADIQRVALQGEQNKLLDDVAEAIALDFITQHPPTNSKLVQEALPQFEQLLDALQKNTTRDQKFVKARAILDEWLVYAVPERRPPPPIGTKKKKKKKKKKPATRPKTKRTTTSDKAGLLFPVGRVWRFLKKSRYAKRISLRGAIYVAAAVQEMTTLFLRHIAQYMHAAKLKRIKPKMIRASLRYPKSTTANYQYEFAILPTRRDAPDWNHLLGNVIFPIAG